ncbi:hypothetical protein [Niabella aurantiaca]|uniref:hypothetical protein n=1 Tax=Niabella aurantiaca TaxID=379900 RepID=UPI00036A175F|nr:hypothetical protein [Niabella aurantiaca]
MGDIIFKAKRIQENANDVTWIAHDGNTSLGAKGLVCKNGDQGEQLLRGAPPAREQQQSKVLKKFLVHFRRPDDYEGAYGFDWLREEYIFPLVTVTHDNNGAVIPGSMHPLCKDVPKLKQEYLRDVKNPIAPYGVRYYPAWLSLFPHTTTQQFPHGSTMHKNGVSLDLQFDELEPMIDDGTEIILESCHEGIEVTPSKFSVAEVIASGKKRRLINPNYVNYYTLKKKVNIKCTKPLGAHEEIKVYAKLEGRKEEVGKLMIYKNNVIPKAEIVVVNVITSPTQKGALRNDYQHLFKNQSFNQALIRAEVKVDTEFDLTALTGHADANNFLIATQNPNTTYAQIRDGFRDLYDKYGKYKATGGIDGNINKRTYLFFTTLSAGNTLGVCSLANNVWGNMYVVFHSGLLHDHTIVHECGHSLSLPHVFQEGSLAKHTFYHGYTDNYMDYTWMAGIYRNGQLYSSGPNKYNGKMYAFYKWQWDIMRGDRSLIFNY